ncbi:MAG TPA: L-arabinose isomerase [Spirochaetia bacterium]|nr:L-arabinose isomerase [Spirochaetia bacterium]
MKSLEQYEVWFVTGSQSLYGEDTLKLVAEHAMAIARGLNEATKISVRVIYKPILTTPDGIHALCLEANAAESCVGLIMWMHTFSPAKMWIAGLMALQKPFVHLHTQFNRDIPWASIDMDFMNLNQSAHGGREFGFMASRLRIERTVIVGYWQDDTVQARLDVWARAASGWHETRRMKVARFGDNMREVAVTEGDKVAAQMQFGYSVNGYGTGDLVEQVNGVTDSDVESLLKIYEDQYALADELKKGGAKRQSLRDAARIELGMRSFLDDGGFKAFTTNFQDLHGLPQLPGIAVQRLMADGYGFGGEGDWKTAALVRAVKVMATGQPGGTSFMEDYTYHLDPKGMKVLGAHMLEVCPSIGDGKARVEIHPLSIGGKGDPVRLVFNVTKGPALNVTLVDMGNRFRMIVNEVDAVAPDASLPKLPVARVVWIPRPNLPVAAATWILGGGAHHTVFSKAVTFDHIQDYAEMAGVEMLRIGEETTVSEFKKELRWNEAYYHMAHGF